MAKAAPKKQTACEQGGDEVLPYEVPIAATDAVTLTTFVCKANARVRAWLEEIPVGQAKLLLDESGKSKVTTTLPALSAGRYMLRWSILAASPGWQTRTEVAVKDTVRFRRRKTADGGLFRSHG